MSLVGTLNLGGSALAAQQAAIQVTGNNISNAGNADYTRQTATITDAPDQQIRPGIFVGTGVDLTTIQRQVNDALEGRLRSATSDSSAATVTGQWLSSVEATFNAVGDANLSTKMSQFFSSWSDLANKPQDMGLRQVVLQNGQSLAGNFTSIRKQLTGLSSGIDGQIQSDVQNADNLALQVASLNSQIVVAEGGSGGTANALRDQRDAVLKKLSGLMDIKTVQESSGSVDVYVGSEPLVSGAVSHGVALRQDEVGGTLKNTVVFKSNKAAIPASSGELAALTSSRDEVNSAVSQLDSLARNLISGLNQLHASGQGLEGYSTVSSTNQVKDPAAALGSTAAGLTTSPANGSFVVHVRQKSTGAVTSTLIHVDPNTTTLNSLQANLNSIGGVKASVSGGKLTLSAASGDVDLSFSQDSSGMLASLGVGSFFTGTNASNIAVNAAVQGNPSLLAASKNGAPGDNQTALAIAALASAPSKGFAGSTLDEAYQAMINGISVKANNAKNNAQATQVVQTTLESQRAALSGVSMDEEAINLVRQQQAYQCAARLINTVNEMMQTLQNITL